MYLRSDDVARLPPPPPIPCLHCLLPQALVVSLGFDTLGTDPEIVPGAGMALTPQDFGHMGASFRAFAHTHALPLLYIQEGGYDLEGISQAAAYMFAVKDVPVAGSA